MRKQGANAHLRFWLGEIEFRPAILLVNRIVGLDGYSRKRIAAFRNPIPDGKIVSRVSEQHQ